MELIRVLCRVVPCSDDMPGAEGQAGAEALALSTVADYAMKGPRRGLTAAEIEDGLANIASVRAWLDSHPGWMSVVVEAPLRVMLKSLESDLNSMEPA